MDLQLGLVCVFRIGRHGMTRKKKNIIPAKAGIQEKGIPVCRAKGRSASGGHE